MHKKILLIATGGTIAMRYDALKQGMVPALTGAELLEAIPPLKTLATIEVVEFSNLPSAQLTPEHLLALRAQVTKALNDADIAGIVIMQGTDTLEESAYFLDLCLKPEKPVVLTAAMRSSSETSADGPHNLICSVTAALDPKLKNCGVVVVMNSEIHNAQLVTKTHSNNLKTFASPFWGPMGVVDGGQVVLKQQPFKKTPLIPLEMTAYVPIISGYIGLEERFIGAILQEPLDGVIIEGFGRGNFPLAMIALVDALVAKGKPVVITSRCLGGRALGSYAAPGAGADLEKRGAIFAGELSSQKARIKLMVALGVCKNAAEIAQVFSE